MNKQIIHPADLVKPIGYAHGIATSGGRLLFLAGQPGLDRDGKIVARGDMVGQFAQAFANLESVVAAAGGTATDMVKLTIYVTDQTVYRENRQAIGEAYRAVFGRYYPAITLVEVKSLFDDDAMVEIDGIAVIDEPMDQ